MRVTDLQIMILITMYKHGARRSFSAVDISDRGLFDTKLSSLGISMKRLVGKGLMEITTPPTRHQRAKYRLTDEGRALAKDFVELSK